MSGAGNNIADIDEDYTLCGNDRYFGSVADYPASICAPYDNDDGGSRVTDISSCGGCAGHCTWVMDVLLDTGSNELLGVMNYIRYRKYDV
ncbi:hypothetical protein EAG_15823 [Camponotus floridanus]|uniref:Uncharacterized protein n=1 Tax=Camponotus floridanus TaxID=104421 RepID=E2AUH1_CAMFO|nr:hypothetical protein EAG_15823 [Camponotus floridanus]